MTSKAATTDGIWIGIDLGTSNSACAIWDSTRGSPKWIRLNKIAKNEGSKWGRMVPSVVRMFGQDELCVGAQALQQQQDSNGILISSIKRLFGKRFQELDPDRMESLPFHVEAADDDDESFKLVIPVNNPLDESCVLVVQTTPLEIASVILKAIKDAAQQYVDRYAQKKHLQLPGGTDSKIQNVVVGVPAHFSKRHVDLVAQACRQAGFKGHVSTCLESTAAAMAYGITMQEKSNNSTIMVIDMGGGTTDITIATKATNNNDVDDVETYSSYKVLVTQGDENLGGDDIDQALLEYCIQQISDENGSVWSNGMRACRQAKESLCQADSPSLLETIVLGEHKVSLSLDQFNLLLKPWMAKAKTLIEQALTEFQKSSNTAQISEVILVGGTTRIPAIRQMIQAIFPQLELCTSLNPASSVAQGLAIQAAIQSKLVPLHELKSALMLDCVPHAIGAELPNGNFVQVIPRNTPLPARGSATFELADLYQQGVTIRAVEQIPVSGSSSSSSDKDKKTNDTVWKYEPMSKEDFTFLLRKLSPDELNQLTSRKIQVGMKIDTQGQFVVSIFDELDPEQVRKRERFENNHNQDNVGELGYITDLVMAEAGMNMEQFMLFGVFVGVFVLYIAVKLAFHEPVDGEPTR